MSKKILQAAIFGTCATAISVTLWLFAVLDRFEFDTWSWNVRALKRSSLSTDKIKVIFIDQKSLDWAAKENSLSWPWTREAYVPVLDFCRRAGAKVIVFDMLYSEESLAHVEDDEAFGRSIGKKKDFVVAFFTGEQAAQTNRWPEAIPRPNWTLTDGDASENREPHATFPIPQVAANATMLANVKMKPDSDGQFRRYSPYIFFDNQPVPSLGLAAYLASRPPSEREVVIEHNRLMRVGKARIPLDSEGRSILRFRGKSGTHHVFSAAQIIQSELRLQEGGKPVIDPSELKDCYVFFGASAPGLKDLRSTPVAEDYTGVEIHATFLDNLLENDFLRDVPKPFAIVISLLLAILAAILVLFSRGGFQTVLAFSFSILVVFGLGFGGYDRGWWWPMVMTGWGMVLAQITALVWNYLTEGRQKRFIKNAFNQLVGPEVLDEIVRDPSKLKLGGDRRELTMFFSDLEKFSSFSEKMKPEQLIEVLNAFLTEMGEIIKEERGYVDKYIGDAIVAFWNAPVPEPNHARLALRAAVRCQRRLAERRDEWAQQYGAVLKMRIGINTGEVIVGFMGSQKKSNYTMLGDDANLASRLEGANKAFGTFIMVSENTWKQLNDEVPGREMGAIRVVGRNAPVRVFEPLGLPGEPLPKKFKNYADALQHVRDKKWTVALEIFSKIENDLLSEKYAERCRDLIEAKTDDWDGVWNLTEK